MPISICRDELARTPFPGAPIEVFRPPAASAGPVADIIPFPRIDPTDCQWPAVWDSEPAIPCEPCVVADDRRVDEALIQPGSRHSTYRMDSPSFHQPVFVTVMPAFRNLSNSYSTFVLPHPTAVLHGGHLMQYFGIRVMALLTIQLLSAWEIGAVAGQTLGTGRYFHSAIWLVLMLSFNLRVWFRYYGQESKAFHIPGVCLFLSAILPPCLLELLAFL